jgi:hypothetical protein
MGNSYIETMNNLFIDIGTHMGGGLFNFINKYNMTNQDWEIHTFEPHPYLFKTAGENNTERQIGYPHSFKDMNESLKLIPQINRHNAACADFDGEVDLFFDKGLEENHMGNTIVKDVYENPVFKNYDFNRSSYINAPVKVKCIDAFNFIMNITASKKINNLIIKIDAEGAEFSILNKFIKSEYKNIFNVDHCAIYCEFHHFMLKNPNEYPCVDSYRNELHKKGAQLHPWG